MTNERMNELILLLAVTEKLPYNKETQEFYYQDKKYDVNKVSNRIYELVSEFMQSYELPIKEEETYVTDNTEKSE